MTPIIIDVLNQIKITFLIKNNTYSGICKLTFEYFYASRLTNTIQGCFQTTTNPK